MINPTRIADVTRFETEQADIATCTPAAPVDVLFSNAARQWLGGHDMHRIRMLRRFASDTSP